MGPSFFFGGLSIGDVLGRTEHLGSSLGSFPHVTQAMYDAHLPVRAEEPMFTVGARPRSNSLLSGPKHSLAIVGVEHITYCRYVHRAYLRPQSKDPAGFIRPDHLIRFKIPYPVTEVGYALGFLQPSSAFLQVS